VAGAVARRSGGYTRATQQGGNVYRDEQKRGVLPEFFAFAWRNKVWWLVPLGLALLFLTLLLLAGESPSPFIYTLS
jgi:hypothetical protein